MVRKRLLALVIGIPLAIAAALVLWVHQEHAGYFSPIYTPDTKEIYFITRQSSGFVIGAGYEFFTPPAHTFVRRDRFALWRMAAKGGDMTLIRDWPASPLEGRRFEAYRGRSFGTVQAHLHWAEGTHLEYEIVVDYPQVPASQTYVVRRRWDSKTRHFLEDDKWEKGYSSMGGYEEDAVRGQWEVLAVPGAEMFPCAVAAHRDGEAKVELLVKTGDCDPKFSEGVTWALLEPESHRKAILRLRDLRAAYQRLVDEGMAKGLPEGEAMLAADRGMQKLGYFPRTPQLVAKLLTENETAELRRTGKLDPLFAISETEFRSGLFPDLEKALNSTGEEIEKSIGGYITMQGYSTSRRLTDYLESGGSLFYVERAARTYAVKLLRP